MAEDVEEVKAEEVQVGWNQPNNSIHEYLSTGVEGYVVEKVGKLWKATGPKGVGVLGKDFKNRAEAFTAVAEKIQGKQLAKNAKAEKAEKAEKEKMAKTKTADGETKVLINARENSVLKVLADAEGMASAKDLAEAVEMEYATVVGVLASLARRKFVELGPEGSSITEGGRNALKTFVEKPKKEKVVREKKVRVNRMEEKYGPRPEGVGPKPSPLEFEECRLLNAKTSLDFALMVQRVHPYSPLAAKKVASAQERVNIVEGKIAELKAKAEGSEAVATEG